MQSLQSTIPPDVKVLVEIASGNFTDATSNTLDSDDASVEADIGLLQQTLGLPTQVTQESDQS